MGLAIAYQLARLGRGDVVVLEAQHLAWGASGRNGGGIRQQWSTEMNIRLMQESVEICQGFAQELGVNVWMRQGGYLFLARSEGQLARMEKAIALQNRCDVPTRLLPIAEAKRIVPELDEGPFVGACYNPTDAIVFPWPFLWGYARAAATPGGGDPHPHPRCTAIESAIWARGGGSCCRPPKGELRAQRVLNAAGAWSPQVARLVGVDAADLAGPPRDPVHRAAEAVPAARWSRCWTRACTSRSRCAGEMVGGITIPEPRTDQVRLGSTLRFVEADGPRAWSRSSPGWAT